MKLARNSRVDALEKRIAALENIKTGKGIKAVVSDDDVRFELDAAAVAELLLTIARTNPEGAIQSRPIYLCIDGDPTLALALFRFTEF